MIAFLEYQIGHEDQILSLKLIKRGELAPPDAKFKQWVDWADPGEVYRVPGFIYLCVQVDS